MATYQAQDAQALRVSGLVRFVGGIPANESKGPGSHCFPMAAASCSRSTSGSAEKSLEVTKEVSPDGETT